MIGGIREAIGKYPGYNCTSDDVKKAMDLTPPGSRNKDAFQCLEVTRRRH
jgi:hypothetical protein